MWLLNLIGIAIGLGMDVFSVSMAVGVHWHGPRQRLRLAWHTGLFQFLMPLVGYGLGSQLAHLLLPWAGYVAAGLLVGVGVKMLIEAVRGRPGATTKELDHAIEKSLHVKTADPTRGWSLIVLSVATSIDALLVGFSLGIKGAGIWQASILIGVTASLMALLGVTVGRRVGVALGRYAELAGGIMLVALGVAMLWF